MFTYVSPCSLIVRFSDQLVSVASTSHTSCIFRQSHSCYCRGVVTKTTITTTTTTTTTITTTTAATTTTTNIRQTPAPTIAGQNLGKCMNMGSIFLDAGLHSYIMLQTFQTMKRKLA